MAESFITLRLEGIQRENRFVLLKDFLQELGHLLNLLNETDRHISARKGLTTYYRVVDLRHSSPATIVLEALPIDPQYDSSHQIISLFFDIITQIKQEGRISKPVSSTILTSLREMALPIGRTLSLITVQSNGNQVEIDKTFGGKVIDLLKPEQTFPGSVRGMLEAINVHKDANVLRMYPDVGPSKITCYFPSDLQEIAISGVGKFVEVRGTLKYRANSQYAEEIKVDYIDIFPDEDDLPSLLDLRGIAPDATGELLSEDFIRELRNAS
ncbi:MAG: hypothetical protein ABIJ39_00315 [Chloroflexota bacterium]